MADCTETEAETTTARGGRGRLCLVVFFSLLIVWLPAQAQSVRSLGIPGTRDGVVTTSEPTAARVGAEILRDGGNAEPLRWPSR